MPRVLVLLVFGFAVPAALGAVVARKDLPTMVQEAEVICLGSVIALESNWDEQHGVIYSLATIKVRQILKGAEPGETLVVRYLGGTVGDIGMSVPGAPAFRSGEDVLLFLTPEEDGSYCVIGMSQGKYAIEYDESTGTAYAKPDLSGLMFLDEREETEIAHVPLQELLTWIEELLAPPE